MNFSLKQAFLVAFVALAVCSTAAAQGARPLIGFNAGFATNSFDGLIGGQLSYEVAPKFDFYPSFEIYFPSGPGSAWSLNANGRYWPKLNMPNPGLYVGGGLGITHVSAFGFGDSRVGLNLLGGWQFHTPSLLPFAELRAILASDVDRIEFVGGLNFKL